MGWDYLCCDGQLSDQFRRQVAPGLRASCARRDLMSDEWISPLLTPRSLLEAMLCLDNLLMVC